MREVYTKIQLNFYLYTPRKLRFYELDFSKLFSRATSNEGRLEDEHSTENDLFGRNRTQSHPPPLTFSGA